MTNTLESKFRKGMNTREIVYVCGMSARPEYYSGRGATMSDLNSDILEKIYQGIKEVHGGKAAGEYVKMVSKIPKLSATDFLLSLYRLEGNKWKWGKGMSGNEKGVYVDGPTDEAKFAVGMISIAHVMSGMNERDETSYIRGQFLNKHDVKNPNDKKRIIEPNGDYWGEMK